MEAFQYHQHQQQQPPYLLDSITTNQSHFEDLFSSPPNIAIPSEITTSMSESHMEFSNSSSMAEQVQKPPQSHKRRNNEQNKCVKEGKGKKQRKCSDGTTKGEEKKQKKKKGCDEEPPSGYIHVRARRGQATDSHSLAERVRREKISGRMKLLQGLVPGCDKVTGKALMLDEIINYVQSLQNQVEFLSMKLASMNPIQYDFGILDLDDYMGRLLSPPVIPSVPQQFNHIQATAFASETTTNNYPSFYLHEQDNNGGDHFVSQVDDISTFQPHKHQMRKEEDNLDEKQRLLLLQFDQFL
ncbi:hypothetical protein QJS10_CPB22g00606 [Acorus calamus]|uniref:BHLH domain-containing protein n=1 Tax=Acorus calamus TaxID=4465 RepID=A0AAV9BY04_ACOCL|nr:hypothetical protein QJS10_CPB22g00595 [Acorus calamus]KAK1282497.1 hypothetical protein QJS10_CPB22g00606 [Acorus calamus]